MNQDNRNGCIFCFSDAKNAPKEHIFPDSLGGRDWACLPDGLVCKSCNSYFGSKIENEVLNDYPFKFFRLFLGIPTKKGKFVRMKTSIGEFVGCPMPGIIGFNPDSDRIDDRIVRDIQEGKINRFTHFTLYPEIRCPKSLCRFLLKVGLECIANDSPEDARSIKFDTIRRIARRPKKNDKWWFYYIEEKGAQDIATRGISIDEWNNDVALEVHLVEGLEVLLFRLYKYFFLTPLEPGFVPDQTLNYHTKDCRSMVFSVVF